MNIRYVKGDTTAPIGEGNKIIVHVCNDVGGWGRGFVLALSNKWKKPEQEYRLWAKSGNNFSLGHVQFVQVESSIWVANLIGQRDTKRDREGNPPVRYDAIKKGLAAVSVYAKEINATVHMPRIGCGLAGGTRDKIEPCITETLSNSGIEAVVYDFE